MRIFLACRIGDPRRSPKDPLTSSRCRDGTYDTAHPHGPTYCPESLFLQEAFTTLNLRPITLRDVESEQARARDGQRLHWLSPIQVNCTAGQSSDRRTADNRRAERPHHDVRIDSDAFGRFRTRSHRVITTHVPRRRHRCSCSKAPVALLRFVIRISAGRVLRSVVSLPSPVANPRPTPIVFSARRRRVCRNSALRR